MQKISIVGAGGMGCAIAKHLSLLGNEIKIYTPFDLEADLINTYHENIDKLPGVKLPIDVIATTDGKVCFENAEIVVISTPSQVVRSSLISLSSHFNKDAVFVCCSKGIEAKTHMLLKDIIADVLVTDKVVILSGPSHAEEIANMTPTALVAASTDLELARIIQDSFMSEYMRIYTTDDVIGVLLGGALKNVIALCAGIVDGLGYGDNTKAALMTRGMAEIARLGESMGARKETFSGLAGIGDLIVTCTSRHSRNRRAGIKIGQGIPVLEAVKSIKMTVEGFESCIPAYELSKEHKVEMPITKALYEIICGELDVREAVLNLMTRERKEEFM